MLIGDSVGKSTVPFDVCHWADEGPLAFDLGENNAFCDFLMRADLAMAGHVRQLAALSVAFAQAVE